jgi:mannitol/fructose-specific phosphotransferase system IIA component (Ntr-type)
MSLARYTREESISTDLRLDLPEPDPEESPEKALWRTKEAVLRGMARLLAASGRVGSENKLFQDLLFREKKASTGIGGGLAIPHIRTVQAKELIVAVALSKEGVDFEAVDRQKVQVFVSMVTPPYEDKLYLRVLKSLGNAFSAPGVKASLLEAKNAGEVIRVLSRLS